MGHCLPIWHLWAWEEILPMMALALDSIMALGTLHCLQVSVCRVLGEGEVLAESVVVIL